MKYTPSLGVLGNIEALMRRETQTNNTVIAQKEKTDNFELSVQADDVEAVCDRYEALIEE